MSYGQSCCLLCRQIVKPKGKDVSKPNPKSAMTGELAKAIRERYAKGDITQKQLSVEFNFSIVTIMNVLRRFMWPDAGGPLVDGRELKKTRIAERNSQPCKVCKLPANRLGKKSTPKKGLCRNCYNSRLAKRRKVMAEERSSRESGVAADQKAAQAKRGNRWCSGHKEFHPVSRFDIDLSRPDGLRSVCRGWAKALESAS